MVYTSNKLEQIQILTSNNLTLAHIHLKPECKMFLYSKTSVICTAEALRHSSK